MRWNRGPQIFLNTGEMVFAMEPCEVKTILGSCVGVAIHDRRNGWGGLCHYLLAKDPDWGNPAVEGSSVRYGNVAIQALVHKFLRRGSRIHDLQAIVAGGSILFDANEVFFVGDANIDMAFKVLDEWRIPVVEKDVGGTRGRRMFFQCADGNYRIEPLHSSKEGAGVGTRFGIDRSSPV